jgi:membrane-associated phospholipid phosphatase
VTTLPPWLETFDESAFLAINGALHRARSGGIHVILRLANEIGNAIMGIPILCAVFVTARRPSWFIRCGLEMGLAMTLVWAVSSGAKEAMERPRPRHTLAGAFERGEVRASFGESSVRGSFPSGHTATAVGFAVVLGWWARRLDARWRRVLSRALLAAGAALTGVARIYSGSHYPLDVAGGAALGALASAAGLVVVGIGAALLKTRFGGEG